MELVYSLLVGAMVAASVYLMLAKDLMRFLFGLILISNAANLAIFTSGRLLTGRPPLIEDGAVIPDGIVANALPQALVLTAIVIGFGLYAFALVLAFRAHGALGTLDTDQMRIAEPKADPE